MPFASEADRQQRRAQIAQLRDVPPEALAALGEAAVVPAFQRAYAHIPAYQQLVKQHGEGCNPTEVTTIAEFLRTAPLLDKHNTFAAFPIHQLCIGGSLDEVRSLLTSSGHGGVFSFGVNTVTNISISTKTIDMVLQYFVDVDERSTLLINCLPMGVRFNTSTAVIAETSVHDGMVYGIINKFAADFDQIVLFGENSFIKKIIEDGSEYHNIDWIKLRVHLCIGEEPVAENYRSYIGASIGIKDFCDANDKLIVSSMGVGELGLNLFHETRDTIRIRRLAHRDPALRVALFGEAASRVCPMLFVYYPTRCYIEAASQREDPVDLAITMLGDDLKIQLPRYRPGDVGQVLTYRDVVATLARFGHAIEPDLKLPFVAVFGRSEMRDGPLCPEAVKEAIYADGRLARLFTGNFKLLSDGDAGRLLLQLREQKTAPPHAVDLLLDLLKVYSDALPQIEILPYAGFPYSMGLDYERKFRYRE